MQLQIQGCDKGLSYRTARWLRQMHSPLCGLNQRFNFVSGALDSSHTITIGAELAGVHVLLDRRPRRPGSYHIGASGLFLEEVLVRTLGETAERYAQMTAAYFGGFDLSFQSYEEMRERFKDTEDLIEEVSLIFFDPSAYDKPGFPYVPFDPSVPMGWVFMESLVSGRRIPVPAQLVLVGYRAQQHRGERPIISSVTTGTAAHRSHDLALTNGLLELIQIDAAVGHWYSEWPCIEVRLDERTRILRNMVERHYGRRVSATHAKFVYIANPDLPAFPIACILRGPAGSLPRVAVGLGCSLSLVEAMHKAWLEALGVWDLASINMIESRRRQSRNTTDEHGPLIYDLDSNVGHYADGYGAEVFEGRFRAQSTVEASDLQEDFLGSSRERAQYLVDAFARSGKELYRLELTTSDIAELGLVVERVWSPDTLSLPLPSAPPTRHRRFAAFGGVTHGAPHPYP
jgi:thiazole/oxazole-forming peptide maturase SagD family component